MNEERVLKVHLIDGRVVIGKVDAVLDIGMDMVEAVMHSGWETICQVTGDDVLFIPLHRIDFVLNLDKHNQEKVDE